MLRLRNFAQFINEAINTTQIQGLIDTLRSEADSEKQRISGTVDKLPWAMKFIVLSAFVNQLQDDMANGRTGAENYGDDLYNNIEGRATQLKQDAINLLKQNGLNPEAASKLDVTPTEEEQPQYDDSRDAYVDANGNAGPNSPANPQPEQQPASVQEAKNWSLVKLVGSLQVGPKQAARQSKPKSPAEKEFRTAFNHARNQIRKVLNPKVETPNHNVINSEHQAAQPPAPPAPNVV